MTTYQKPQADIVAGQTEGVYMASGTKAVCRFGRTYASADVDTCQACSKTNGEQKKVTKADGGAYRHDYKGCIDGMPEKEK